MENGLDQYLDSYIKYLQEHKHMSQNTLDAYKRDILQFNSFANDKGIYSVSDVTNADVVSYIMGLKEEGRTGSTINRKTASIRSYAEYLSSQGILKENPVLDIKPPKVERQNIDFLSIEEVELILDAPDDSIKGLRDKSILEMLYGTGIRVTELIELRLSDINFRIGFITCNGEFGKARIIPLGRPCKEALGRYIDDSRPKLLAAHQQSLNNKFAGEVPESLKKESEDEFLFVNYHGEKLTRQGLWKIVRLYAETAGLDKKLTPQILRNSFAAHMVQNGADLKSIQELMGYEDVTTVQIYLNVTKNRIKEVYDRTHPRA